MSDKYLLVILRCFFIRNMASQFIVKADYLFHIRRHVWILGLMIVQLNFSLAIFVVDAYQ